MQKATELCNCSMMYYQQSSLCTTTAERGVVHLFLDMADQHVLLLSGMVLILVVQLSAGSDCSEESMQEMQIQFNDCAAGLGNQFVDTRNTFHGMEYIQVGDEALMIRYHL